MNIKKNIVFTVCNIAYIHKALALAESIYLKDQLITKIYIVDSKRDTIKFDFAEIIWIEDIGIQNWRHLAFKYDVTEFSTSIKPFIAKSLLLDYDNVIFLDPDTYVYRSLSAIFNQLLTSDLILTPHYIKPHEFGDLGMLRFGSFNLGFFAVNSSKRGIDFLSWWWERCSSYCFFETQFGLSTDQKWVSIAPCFFPWINISHDLTLNMAFWNLHERTLMKENDLYLVNGLPLTFFHFSSFDESNPANLSTRPIPYPQFINKFIEELCFSYFNSTQRFKNIFTSSRYSFDYMSDGSYISPTLRRAYASRYQEFSNIENPFIYDGRIKKFILSNYLRSNSTHYVSQGFSNINDQKNKFKLINLLMKIILLIIGPNNFMNLSRLFVYLSSFRLNSDLWKL